MGLAVNILKLISLISVLACGLVLGSLHSELSQHAAPPVTLISGNLG